MGLDELFMKLPRHLVSQIKEEADGRPIVNCTDCSNSDGLERKRRMYPDLSSFLCDSSEVDFLVDSANSSAPFVIVDKVTEDVGWCRRAREEAQCLRTAGRFKQASFGGGSSKCADVRTRSDDIVWIRREDLVALPACSQIVSLFEEIRASVDKSFLRLGTDLEVDKTEMQLSVYPSTDRFLTAILYLNEDWKPACGGCLRLYLDDCRLDVSPRLGKLVVFRSEQLEHSVMPVTCADRYAITCWFSVRRRAAG
ncbi:putative 2OG-Fe(II) oxygenase family protein [Neospora caninum Liverpool]|uniref:Putative 2OG-Fe(II) oxygenase family protein n=1 Tax=Neospora caninum (strain Liverpool) TaxID=572307 RepID=F0VID2_NEOCL|nr:putative 2OG-Fe(II) oxygenase family protein [Neospora caninum Liverpool]CBZ53493.1 putative 2OG-Fe(II) oxygenase family protein [Neospora caninum Liverpool]|eukprot:XP_003883525.1 putative 2OG-Fe(II) oxygenase family protein [Neospora caninum Liverpool]